jgi:hypothetical protein
MFQVYGVHSIKIALIFCIAFVSAIWSTEVYGQDENSPRPIDKPATEENSTIQENTPATFPLVKPSTTKQGSTAIGIKRELSPTGAIQERELKKNESPSTLSFNIFLYIVDKFKED